MKIPLSNLQITNNFQIPMIKISNYKRFGIDYFDIGHCLKFVEL